MGKAPNQKEADKFAEQFDVIGWDVVTAIREAKAGDVESARWLLAEFCATVSNNRLGKPLTVTTFDERLLDYLRECFALYLGDKDMTADLALHLATKGKRGAKAKASTREKSLARGLKAWDKYKELSGNGDLPPADNRTLNATLEAAFEAIGKEESASRATILRDYREWRSVVMKARDEALEQSGRVERGK